MSSRISMHTLLVRILEHRQLSHAGQLFAISDYDVIMDLHRTLAKVKTIFNGPGYHQNTNDQSVVEIVLARITAAIRETNSIETYAPALVDTLGSCLCHRMTINTPGDINIDTPHCRIACELLNSLFLHYNKKSVMTITVPTAIRALNCGSDELTRNTTSYLSLAAIHNGRLLSQYSVQIISNILSGNHALVRVIPQLYPENREPFHAHFPQLLKLLQSEQTDQSERLSILQFASMVTNAKPELIIIYLDDLDKYLFYPATRTAMLHIYLSLISLNHISVLSSRLSTMRKAIEIADSESTVATIAKIIGKIGRNDSKTAEAVVTDLIALTIRLPHNMPIMLKEIEGIAECFPETVRPHVNFVRSLSTTQLSAGPVCARIITLASEPSPFLKNFLYSPCSDEVTVINVDRNDQSEDLMMSDSSLKAPNVPIISNGARTTVKISDSAELSAQELDKNTENLANAYMRSSCSLTNQRSRSRASLNLHNDNVTVIETNARDSPLSIVSSHKSRRPDGTAVVPVFPPPVYQPPKGNTFPQQSNAISSVAVQMGRDGRVRPIPVNARRNARQWIPLNTSTPAQCYETTFPASDAGVLARKPSPDDGGGHAHTVDTTSLFDGASSQTNPGQTKDDRQLLNRDTADRDDVVRQFVDHRRAKIQNYVENLSKMYPIPIQCTVEGSKGSEYRIRVHFRCQICDDHCMYYSNRLFNFKTHLAPIWIHIMFLQMEASSIETTGQVLAQDSTAYQTLANCWSFLPVTLTRNRPLSQLVTSAFPAIKEQQHLMNELNRANFFEAFSYNSTVGKWSCFSCNNPERVRSILQQEMLDLPVLEGQLKEKCGRWKFLRRWQTKYFTLSSAALTCREQSANPSKNSVKAPSIDLRKIRSVKSLSKNRKSRKSLPKAFEIFTDDDRSYLLKANDQSQAEEWIQCLQIAISHAHKD